MYFRKSSIIGGVMAVSAAALAVSCNSGTTSIYEEDDYENANVMVRSFSFKENKDICENLNNVFFSIDLKTGNIYNADSLPYGAPIDKLIPVLTFPSEGIGAAEFHIPREGNTDSIVAWEESFDSELNFSRGPVTLRVTSLSNHFVRDYKIKVNVHKEKPDTMIWRDLAVAENGLPGGLATASAQRTVKMGDRLFCLVKNGTDYRISSTTTPGADQWKIITPSFGFTPDVNSLMATSDALYLKAEGESGTVYKSSDGSSWSSTGIGAYSLISSYGSSVFAVKKSGDAFSIVKYPENEEIALPEGFPVEGASVPCEYSVEWQLSPVSSIAGGRTADGKLSNYLWSYDGHDWAKITNKGFSEGLYAPVMVPYFTIKIGSYWTIQKSSVFMIMGGSNAEGKINRKVYLTKDYGLTWYNADKYMQLPDEVPVFVNAQAYTIDTKYEVPKPGDGEEKASRASNGWRPVKGKQLMPYMRLALPQRSRMTQLPTSWDCPYIYMFGGYDAEGKLSNTVWRGVLNRFTFVPIV